MKKNINEYPVIKKELEKYNNVKTYCVSTFKDNYIFPEIKNNKNEITQKQYSLETWKKVIAKLNWNY